MVEPVPASIPRIQVTTTRKVDRKPDFKDEEKYKERERHAQREKDRLSRHASAAKKGDNLDLLL